MVAGRGRRQLSGRHRPVRTVDVCEIRVVIGFARLLVLTYLGVGRNASTNYEVFGDLRTRAEQQIDLARVGRFGFRRTPTFPLPGAISAMPVGFAYLMFAPFPWQATNFRQAITMPEVLIWWAMIPLL